MSITTDKLVCGKQVFDGYVRAAKLRAHNDEYVKSDIGVLWAAEKLESLEAKVEALTLRINEAMEVYAGMEGINPPSSEATYLLRIIEQMYKALLEQK